MEEDVTAPARGGSLTEDDVDQLEPAEAPENSDDVVFGIVANISRRSSASRANGSGAVLKLMPRLPTSRAHRFEPARGNLVWSGKIKQDRIRPPTHERFVASPGAYLACKTGVALHERCEIGKPGDPHPRDTNGAMGRPCGLEDHSGDLPEWTESKSVIHVDQGAFLRSRPAVSAIIGSHEVDACLMECLHRIRRRLAPRHISEQRTLSFCTAGAAKADRVVLLRYRNSGSPPIEV